VARTEEGAKGKTARGKGGPQAVTANRLADGIVVFLAADGGWVEHPDGAVLARQPGESEALMAKAEQAVADRVIVGPYLIDMVETASGPEPAALRERIRAAGPTVRRDLGKQADREEQRHVPL
jgi:hypothetical protein